mmetsp:Transcript_5218/g.13267  ORF Transcript_5218/g.13267 Transcript_5218/m.13267 type:complete len:348 (-) Transcript_5218:204-1247(-)
MVDGRHAVRGDGGVVALLDGLCFGDDLRGLLVGGDLGHVLVLARELVVGVALGDADCDWPREGGQVKHDDVAAEEHVADEHHGHAAGHALHARLVRVGPLRDVPVTERDLVLPPRDVDEKRVLLGGLLGVAPDHVLPLGEGPVANHARHGGVGEDDARGARVEDACDEGGVALVPLATNGNLHVWVGELEKLDVAEAHRVHGHRVVVGLDGGGDLHLADDRVRVDAPQLDLRLRVGREEGEGAALEHVVLVVVLDAGVREVKEEGEGELWGGHAGEGHGHRLGEAEAEDAVDALKVGGVARGDAAKLCEREVVAELNDVVGLVALEGRVVGVLEEELTVLDVAEGLG